MNLISGKTLKINRALLDGEVDRIRQTLVAEGSDDLDGKLEVERARIEAEHIQKAATTKHPPLMKLPDDHDDQVIASGGVEC